MKETSLPLTVGVTEYDELSVNVVVRDGEIVWVTLNVNDVDCVQVGVLDSVGSSEADFVTDLVEVGSLVKLSDPEKESLGDEDSVRV